MGNRLTRKTIGLSSESTYQSNLNSIEMSSMVYGTGMQDKLQNNSGLYRMNLPSNTDYFTGTTMRNDNESSYGDNSHQQIDDNDIEWDNFLSYEDKVDAFNQKGGWKNDVKTEDLPWIRQSENERIVSGVLREMLIRDGVIKENDNTIYNWNRLLGGDDIISLGTGIGLAEDNRNKPVSWQELFYVGDRGLTGELRSSLQRSLEIIRDMLVNELTGVAERIMGILSIVKPHPAIVALHIVIGLCVVAQKVQKRRKDAKDIMEKQGWKTEEIPAVLKNKVPEWFAEEAGKYFIGNWISGLSKNMVDGRLQRIATEQVIGEYYDFLNNLQYNESEITISEAEIDEWEEMLKNKYSEKGITE